jgi:hypothetical protein
MLLYQRHIIHEKASGTRSALALGEGVGLELFLSTEAVQQKGAARWPDGVEKRFTSRMRDA